MARIKIEQPKEYLFSTTIQLTINMINYGGHLGNDSVLSLAHEARIRFLQSLGYTELDIEGNGVIMTDCGVNYKSEGFLGNEIIIHVGVNDVSSRGFDLVYKMENKTTDKLLAIVKTGIVMFNYETRKLATLSETFLSKLNIEL